MAAEQNNKALEELARQRAEREQLKEEICEIVMLLPSGAIVKYLHSFVMAFIKRYDSTFFEFWQQNR